MKYISQHEYLKRLGKKIKDLRLEKGFSQSELCYEAEIDISTLSRLERGILNVSFSTLYKIGRILDVEIIEFFS